MQHSEYIALVRRAERLSRDEPERYRRRIAAIAAIGHGYPLAVLVLFVAVAVWSLMGLHRAGGLMQATPFLIVLAGAVLALNSLLARPAAPRGIELQPHDAPRLLDLVHDTARALDSPPPDVVVLSDECNASLAQLPRVALPGPSRSYLVLGLTLLQGVSPAQLRAIMAHELGHLSRQRTWLERWVHRVRNTWLSLAEEFQAGRRGHWLLRPFCSWYAPRLSAWTFPLDREHERRADEAAARCTDARTAADALLASLVRSRHLDEVVWPELYDRVATSPAPPRQPYGVIAERALRSGIDGARVERWLRQELNEPTDSYDVHPSLGERLASYGLAEELAATLPEAARRLSRPLQLTAADRYLGAGAQRLAAVLDDAWLHGIDPDWRERHAYVREALARIDVLAARPVRELPDSEATELARLTSDVHGPEAAEELFREVLRRNPRHADALFGLGQVLVARDEPEAVDLLERAMEHDAEYVVPACSLLVGYFRLCGDHERARRYYALGEERAHLEADAADERSRISDHDRYTEHGLAETTLQRIRRQLGALPEVEQVLLARKLTEVLPDSPHHVLAVRWRGEWYDAHKEADPSPLDRLITRLQWAFPEGLFDARVVTLNESGMDRVERKLREVDGSVVHEAAADASPAEAATPGAAHAAAEVSGRRQAASDGSA